MVSYRRSFWIGLVGFISMDNKWSHLEEIGQGTGVDVITGKDGRSHFAWCGEDNKIHYLAEGSSNESLDPSSCGHTRRLSKMPWAVCIGSMLLSSSPIILTCSTTSRPW